MDVGELYADEERRFLLFVDVPWAYSIDEVATRLFKVRCTYLDTATGQSVDVAGEDAVVLRPLEAAKDMALARAAAERGAYAEAARILDACWDLLSWSAPRRCCPATRCARRWWPSCAS